MPDVAGGDDAETAIGLDADGGQAGVPDRQLKPCLAVHRHRLGDQITDHVAMADHQLMA